MKMMMMMLFLLGGDGEKERVDRERDLREEQAGRIGLPGSRRRSESVVCTVGTVYTKAG